MSTCNGFTKAARILLITSLIFHVLVDARHGYGSELISAFFYHLNFIFFTYIIPTKYYLRHLLTYRFRGGVMRVLPKLLINK